MYKLSVYENKMSFKYRVSHDTYRFKWQANLMAYIACIVLSFGHQYDGVYITYEIEKIHPLYNTHKECGVDTYETHPCDFRDRLSDPKNCTHCEIYKH